MKRCLVLRAEKSTPDEEDPYAKVKFAIKYVTLLIGRTKRARGVERSILSIGRCTVNVVP